MGTKARKPNPDKTAYIFIFILMLSASVPFLSLLKADFVNWDDDIYITANERVVKGISWENIKWAFSTIFFGFYYPVTWLSHMLDVSIYGLKAWGHHLTSIIIHILNSIFFYAFLNRATKENTKSFIAAALFAVHPLNVESVAWLSERKNLLAAFFFLLALNLYLAYLKKPARRTYAGVFLAYILGLMSKSVVVTFPLVLYLIDIWPIRRTELSKDFIKTNYKRLIYEKLPFLLPVPLFVYLTILGQNKLDTLASFDRFPLDQRIAGAILAYARYIYNFLFPIKLTSFYNHLGNNYHMSTLFFSIMLLLILLTAFLMYFKKNNLYLICFLWFIVNLLPVIGIIQVGGQGSADRYMYIPIVGLLAILVFGVFEIAGKSSFIKPGFIYIFFSVVFVLFAVKSHFQSRIWISSEALFSNMITTSPNPAQGYVNMGIQYKQKGDYVTAVEYYTTAIKADPLKADAYNNRGNALFQLKDIAGANDDFKKACALNPEHPVMVYNLGLSEEGLGHVEKAKEQYLRALSLNNNHKKARIALITILSTEKNFDEAIRNCEIGEKLADDDADFSRLKCSILILHSKYEEAKKSSEEALRNYPDDPNLFYTYGEACLNLNELDNAEKGFLGVLKFSPNTASANYKLALIKLKQNKSDDALEYLKRASVLAPDNPQYKEEYRDLAAKIAH
jgi:protein O-mannosyl-transferase